MDWLIDLFSSQQIVFQLAKLHTLGLKPMLLIGKHKNTSVMMPQKVQLSAGAKTCLQSMEEIFALMVEGEIVQHVLY